MQTYKSKTMKNHGIIVLIFVSQLFYFGFSQEKQNILFISIDDLNDWIGVFEGNNQVHTPNLDKFNAQGGLVMYNAQAPATVCGPSRSAILTGVHAHNTGVYGNRNNLKFSEKAKGLITMPQYFSKHGYHSISMGKIFHKHPNLPDGSKGTDNGEWAFDEWHKTFRGVGPISKERPVNGLPVIPGGEKHAHAKLFDWGPTKNNDETLMKDFLTVQWAVEQLNSRDFDGKPFFMAIGFSKPHLKWFVPQKYFDMYPLDKIVLPELKEDDLDDIINKYGKKAHRKSFSWERAEKYGKHKEAVQAYMATVSFVDDCIGVLMEGLNKSKYAENTIVVLWSDHGWHLGEKYKYGKTYLWKESARVPLMIKVPGVTQKNKRSYGVVNLIDMYPTLIELTGLPPNPMNDGHSFAKLLHNPDMQWNEPTLTTDKFKNHRIYDGRYSYINSFTKGYEELYDHQKDPMEWNNLADNVAYAQIKERLKQYLPKSDELESPRNKK